MSAEPSLAARILADAVLSTHASAYHVAGTDTQRGRVLVNAANVLDPLLAKIIAEAIRATISHPT